MIEHADSEDYVRLAYAAVAHNDDRRNYAAEMLEDQEYDQILAVHFAANTKVIFDEEGRGAYVTCSLWIPNPNAVEEEEEDDDDDGS